MTASDTPSCHLNPAVTLGFFGARRIEARHVAPYIAAQCVGAGPASLTLWALFPAHPTLGVTLPAGPAAQAFVMEAILTLILMFVILSGSKEKGVLAGVAVGSMIALEALFAGPVSGASISPARSLAPAVVTGRLEHLWVYLTAPVCGAGLAVAVCLGVHGPRCCAAAKEESR
jgi:aquaporin Z